MDLQIRGYSTIIADPPWEVKAGRYPGAYTMQDGKQLWTQADPTSRQLVYPTMTLDEIKSLNVGGIAAKDAHLYLWTINKYVEQAFDVARAWGFNYSTLLTWAKNPKGSGLGGCYGISTEYVLFCRRGSLAAKADINTTWFNWKRPYDERGKPKHSAKPPEFIEMVERVSPGPYIELFARENRTGWDAWGNQCEVRAEAMAA
jgi:N6-adenosine-specific RNA methylase IME4